MLENKAQRVETNENRSTIRVAYKMTQAGSVGIGARGDGWLSRNLWMTFATEYRTACSSVAETLEPYNAEVCPIQTSPCSDAKFNSSSAETTFSCSRSALVAQSKTGIRRASFSNSALILGNKSLRMSSSPSLSFRAQQRSIASASWIHKARYASHPVVSVIRYESVWFGVISSLH